MDPICPALPSDPLGVLGSARAIMELLSQPRPLSDLLCAICAHVENGIEGVFCTIMLVSEDSTSLELVGWHKLPGAVITALPKVPISPDFGTCGRAAALREPVTSMIATDARWPEPIRTVTLAQGLRVCYSVPIIALEGQLLGTFALYSNQEVPPDPHHIDTVRRISDMLSLSLVHQRTQTALQRSSVQLELMTEWLSQGLWELNLETREIIFQSLEPPHDAPVSEQQQLSMEAFVKRIHTLDRPRLDAMLKSCNAQQPCSIRMEFRYRTTTEQPWRWLEIRGRVVDSDERGRPRRLVGIHRDVTADKQLSERLRLLATVVERIGEGLVVVKPNSIITYTNKEFWRLTELNQNTHKLLPHDLFMKEGSSLSLTDLRERLGPDHDWSGEIRIQRQDGTSFPARVNVSGLHSTMGPLTHLLILFSDKSEEQEREARLRRATTHDPLTDLPNRLFLRERVVECLARARREHERLALVVLGLDRFRVINEVLGPEVGDQFLQELARRMRASLRETDLVARVGGDEFALLLEGIREPMEVLEIMERVRSSLRALVQVGEHGLIFNFSAGVSLFPDDANTEETLFSHAHAGMNGAKQAGGDCYRFFAPDMDRRSREHVELRTQLLQAVERNEFILHYQPKVLVHTREVIGVEALIRWNHPQKGMISPMRFIPLAEELGLIQPIGEWALYEACRQGERWRQAGLRPLRMAVNLSVEQLRDELFPERVAQILRETGFPAECLELEVTETSLTRDPAKAGRLLSAIKDQGIHISIDDFGVGFSSLTYLRMFPIHAIKIDRSFVSDLDNDPNDATIVRAVIGLGHNLGLEVIAEGVENQAQLHFLQENGCDSIQGYLFSPPVNAQQLQALLAQPMKQAADIRR